jgi:hypothetical protein
VASSCADFEPEVTTSSSRINETQTSAASTRGIIKVSLQEPIPELIQTQSHSWSPAEVFPTSHDVHTVVSSNLDESSTDHPAFSQPCTDQENAPTHATPKQNSSQVNPPTPATPKQNSSQVNPPTPATPKRNSSESEVLQGVQERQHKRRMGNLFVPFKGNPSNETPKSSTGEQTNEQQTKKQK